MAPEQAKLADTNVLIYAVDEASPHHLEAKHWLDGSLNSTETVLIPWMSLLAFVRLTTHPSISAAPLTTDQALSIVDRWLTSPAVEIPRANSAVTVAMRGLLAATGRGGNLVNDAFLAAIALEHRCEVVTFDNDFGRFPGVRWQRPAPVATS
ncbi:MAG: PIN domain-containing protein [Bifidobacteriaceae bacterium]|nr:PIN domain-containing protein [Bifidobacteriaceae bacterium]